MEKSLLEDSLAVCAKFLGKCGGIPPSASAGRGVPWPPAAVGTPLVPVLQPEMSLRFSFAPTDFLWPTGPWAPGLAGQGSSAVNKWVAVWPRGPEDRNQSG